MPRLKEDRIKPPPKRQSINMPIVNQDDAYVIKLVFIYAVFFSFSRGKTFSLSMEEFMYPQTPRIMNPND